MTAAPEIDSFFEQTRPLRALGGQRVWSLMVSLFGDLAQDEGQSIDGPLLSAIMQRLDIKPEATRVALHRLRKDGWLRSDKSGRISHHSLTVEGRAQSVAASPRIYADPHRVTTDWQLVVTEAVSEQAEAALTQAGFVSVVPRVFVGPKTSQVPTNALVFTGQSVPNWLREQATPSSLTSNYEDLLGCLEELQTNLPPSMALTPLDVAVLRCLIVHNWRRLVLKHPMLPAPLVEKGWPGHRCHLAVWDLLQRFPRPALSALADHRAAA